MTRGADSMVIIDSPLSTIIHIYHTLYNIWTRLWAVHHCHSYQSFVNHLSEKSRISAHFPQWLL